MGALAVIAAGEAVAALHVAPRRRDLCAVLWPVATLVVSVSVSVNVCITISVGVGICIAVCVCVSVAATDTGSLVSIAPLRATVDVEVV
jgi:hypothetical protein